MEGEAWIIKFHAPLAKRIMNNAIQGLYGILEG